MAKPSPEQLAQCALFGGLDDECRRELCARMECVSVPQDGVVYEEGDPARAMYVVTSGRLRAFKTSLGPKAVMADLVAGDFFGDMSFIDMQPRSATVRAVEPSDLWRLDFAVLRQAYQSDLKCYTLLVMNIARELSRRLRRAEQGCPAAGEQRGHGG